MNTCKTAQQLKNGVRAARFGTNEMAQARARMRQHENTCRKCKAVKK